MPKHQDKKKNSQKTLFDVCTSKENNEQIEISSDSSDSDIDDDYNVKEQLKGNKRNLKRTRSIDTVPYSKDNSNKSLLLFFDNKRQKSEYEKKATELEENIQFDIKDQINTSIKPLSEHVETKSDIVVLSNETDSDVVLQDQLCLDQNKNNNPLKEEKIDNDVTIIYDMFLTKQQKKQRNINLAKEKLKAREELSKKDTQTFFSNGNTTNSFFQKQTYKVSTNHSSFHIGTNLNLNQSDTQIWKNDLFPSIPYVPIQTYESESHINSLIHSSSCIDIPSLDLCSFFNNMFNDCTCLFYDDISNISSTSSSVIELDKSLSNESITSVINIENDSPINNTRSEEDYEFIENSVSLHSLINKTLTESSIDMLYASNEYTSKSDICSLLCEYIESQYILKPNSHLYSTLNNSYLWSDLFAPHTISHMYSIFHPFYEWLNEKKQKLDYQDDDDDWVDTDYYDITQYEANVNKYVYLLMGPSSTGKTIFVQIAAKYYNFDCITMTPLECRSSKSILTQLQEVCCMKTIGKKGKVKNHSIILFEDVDVCTESDIDMYKGIQSIILKTKIPIILTSTHSNATILSMVSHGHILSVPDYSFDYISYILRSISIANNILITEDEINSIIYSSNMNIRQCINLLQCLYSSSCLSKSVSSQYDNESTFIPVLSIHNYIDKQLTCMDKQKYPIPRMHINTLNTDYYRYWPYYKGDSMLCCFSSFVVSNLYDDSYMSRLFLNLLHTHYLIPFLQSNQSDTSLSSIKYKYITISCITPCMFDTNTLNKSNDQYIIHIYGKNLDCISTLYANDILLSYTIVDSTHITISIQSLPNNMCYYISIYAQDFAMIDNYANSFFFELNYSLHEIQDSSMDDFDLQSSPSLSSPSTPTKSSRRNSRHLRPPLLLQESIYVSTPLCTVCLHEDEPAQSQDYYYRLNMNISDTIKKVQCQISTSTDNDNEIISNNLETLEQICDYCDSISIADTFDHYVYLSNTGVYSNCIPFIRDNNDLIDDKYYNERQNICYTLYDHIYHTLVEDYPEIDMTNITENTPLSTLFTFDKRYENHLLQIENICENYLDLPLYTKQLSRDIFMLSYMIPSLEMIANNDILEDITKPSARYTSLYKNISQFFKSMYNKIDIKKQSQILHELSQYSK